jgi:2-polyprenyl-3-methyl-5-hydroxy-6-metoxy-1,4-benzoquinol methylase
MKEEIEKKEDNAEVIVVKSMHEQWIQHPMTQVVLKAFAKHKEKFILEVANSSRNMDISNESIRLNACGIIDFACAIDLIKNPEILIRKVS